MKSFTTIAPPGRSSARAHSSAASASSSIRA
jgi:hypothetical protein